MDDSIEFTAKEKYRICVYSDPDTLFTRVILTALGYLIPSLLMVAYFVWSGDVAVGCVGYGLLLFYTIRRLCGLRNALRATATILRKYEAQLQALRGRSPTNS